MESTAAPGIIQLQAGDVRPHIDLLKESANALGHVVDSITDNQVIQLASNIQTKLDKVGKDTADMKQLLQVLTLNTARVYNKTAVLEDDLMQIPATRSYPANSDNPLITEGQIPSMFPRTRAHIDLLDNEQLQYLLLSYNLSVPANKPARKKTFMNYIGIR